MSIYALQKLIRDVNRDPKLRESYFAAPETIRRRLRADRRRSARRCWRSISPSSTRSASTACC